MRFDIITIFPEMFNSVLGTSILKRAIEDKKIEVNFLNPRDYTTDKHKTVDDTPYGGGPGMVMKVEPLAKAIQTVQGDDKARVILLSAKGERFTQQKAKQLAEEYGQLVLVCGHYEGVDERVLNYVDEELSIGDYVMTGGELGVMVILDTVSRLVPGVLGDESSLKDESHSTPGYIEYPQYTRPEKFEGQRVPDVLLSGNHQAIEKWRTEQSQNKKNK